MGASFGAVGGAATAWRHPGVFGRLLLQSGSFAFADIGQHNRGPVFDPVAEVRQRVSATGPTIPRRRSSSAAGCTSP